MATLCKDYKPRDKDDKRNCPNCYRWTGIGCENHSALTDNRQTRKTDAIDKDMRSNRVVWIG